MAASDAILEIEGRQVTITHPDKLILPKSGHTKLDLVRYYLAVAAGALRGVHGRPMALKRYPNGADQTPFFQKRAPTTRPDWIETVELRYPSGGRADEVVVTDAAQLAWIVNLGCIDLHPHLVRATDLDHPDELRVDLDPVRGVAWPQVRQVALVVREVLTDYGLVGWPKTSGSRGLHIYCRIAPRWTFPEVRRAAMALARDVERRAPELATSRWWKEERHGVFIDYNQNARDRTTAAAYSIRPTPDARASAPLDWDEVPDCDPAAFTIDTLPARLAQRGDPGVGIDAAPGAIDGLLELAARQAEAGLLDEGAPRSGSVPPPAPGKHVGPTGRRRTTAPLIEVARAASEPEALRGLERWRQRHPQVWAYLAPNDVLVDSMRGRSAAWTRIRINLHHVPEPHRPVQEPLEVDYDPWAAAAASNGHTEPHI